MLHEFNEIIKVHLSALRPVVTIMLGEVLTKRNSGGMNQLKPHI